MELKRIDSVPLADSEIIGLIKDRKEEAAHFDRLRNYYKGKNEHILSKPVVDPNNPDYRVPVPYGRKIVNTVVGYMYKPGLIRYSSEQQRYLEAVNEIFDDNNEGMKTARAGKDSSLYGEAFELAYVTGVARIEEEFKTEGVMRFAPVEPQKMVALYNQDIEPDIVAAIRYWPVANVSGAAEYHDVVETERVDVIYQTSTFQYLLLARKRSTSQGRKLELVFLGEDPHTFTMVPVVHYVNNEEQLGDFEPVITLIDAYDSLASGSMIEFFRFANAYLRLVQRSLKPEDVRRLRLIRLFEKLQKPDDVTFLTKDINTEYIELMLRTVRRDIHVQSHVPDFTDERFKGDMSGVAIRRLLYDFENLAASKEMWFNVGLNRRLDLVDDYFQTARIEVDGSRRDMSIRFGRNLEVDIKEIAETAEKMQATTSRRTALTIFPETIIPDVDAEMAQIEEEAAMSFDVEQMMPVEEEEEEEIEVPTE